MLNTSSQVGSVKKAWFFQEGKQCPGESWQMIISRGCWWKAKNKLPFFPFIMQQVHLFSPDEHSQGHLLLLSCTNQEQQHSLLKKKRSSMGLFSPNLNTEAQCQMELSRDGSHVRALKNLYPGTWHLGVFLSHCGIFTTQVTTNLQGSLEYLNFSGDVSFPSSAK